VPQGCLHSNDSAVGVPDDVERSVNAPHQMLDKRDLLFKMEIFRDGGKARVAVSEQVKREYAIPPDQFLFQTPPLASRTARAMQKDDRLSLAFIVDPEPGPMVIRCVHGTRKPLNG